MISNMHKLLSFILLLSFSANSFSQAQRSADHNSIGWLVYTGNLKITKRLAIHTEYQWRGAETIKSRQQDLLRTGINYSLSKEVNIVAGYAFAQTYVYGDYPAAFAFPEHRIFQQLNIKNPVGGIDLSHRFTLEQRFVGRVTMPGGIKNTTYSFLNRIRYRVRAEIPLHKKTAVKKLWSVIAQDELFIGWGKNTGSNVFDQNRIGLLLGYKLHRNIKLEAGYINQILQQARRINDKDIFQYNHGVLLAAAFNFDLRNRP